MQNPRPSPSRCALAGLTIGLKLLRDHRRAFATASGLLPALRGATPSAWAVRPARVTNDPVFTHLDKAGLT